MSLSVSKGLAFTAAAGLVAGLAGCGEKKEAKDPTAEGGATEPAPVGTEAAAEGAGEGAEAAAKDCCKGKNECKGKGLCAVEGANDCKGKNECKGKGGCTPADCK